MGLKPSRSSFITRGSSSVVSPARRMLARAGTIVKESASAVMMATMNVIAMGWNILPSMPTKAKIGRKTTTMISSPKPAAVRISTAALYTAPWRSRPVRARPSSRRFSSMTRTQWSRRMTAPSTMIPKSSAPKLMRLPETPSFFMKMKVPSRDKGIVTAVMRAARMFPMSRKRMMTTSAAPVTRLCSTVRIVELTSSDRS
jgi:hypothetical protein